MARIRPLTVALAALATLALAALPAAPAHADDLDDAFTIDVDDLADMAEAVAKSTEELYQDQPVTPEEFAANLVALVYEMKDEARANGLPVRSDDDQDEDDD